MVVFGERLFCKWTKGESEREGPMGVVGSDAEHHVRNAMFSMGDAQITRRGPGLRRQMVTDAGH